jgi:predicted dehydrogenase
MRKVKWGVLGAANIAVKKVIPAMHGSEWSEVVKVASLRESADAYDALLADPQIEAIYNPLPNQLHVPWTIRAAEAGKHVLCEKPIGLNAAEVESLIAVRDRTGVNIGEAFMTHVHPQWLRARELVRQKAIGDLKLVTCVFSYFNRQAENIRNQSEMGGGGLMDIGCYPITMSRFLFGSEPVRVAGMLELDPEFGVDRLTSGMLEFTGGQCVFSCSTQMSPYQRVLIFGTTGRIEIEIPFNAPPDQPTRILVNDQVEEFPVCDQYALQADAFSRAVCGEGDVPVPLEDALQNMRVIEQVRMQRG